jgi:hypothetical protein
MEGGGGPESALKYGLRSAASDASCGSRVPDGFRAPPSVLPLTKGGGSGMNIPGRWVHSHKWHHPIGQEVPSPTCRLTAPHPLLSPTTEPTCPTRSWSESHLITSASPCCQASPFPFTASPLRRLCLQLHASTSSPVHVGCRHLLSHPQVARCTLITG